MATFELVKAGGDSIDLHASIQIAVANIPVRSADIEASYLGKPNLSRDRLKPFTNLLNEISCYQGTANSRIDLVVFPGKRSARLGVDAGGMGSSPPNRSRLWVRASNQCKRPGVK